MNLDLVDIQIRNHALYENQDETHDAHRAVKDDYTDKSQHSRRKQGRQAHSNLDEESPQRVCF